MHFKSLIEFKKSCKDFSFLGMYTTEQYIGGQQDYFTVLKEINVLFSKGSLNVIKTVRKFFLHC